MFENKAVERFRFAQRKMQAQLAVEFGQAAASFQQEAAVVMGQELSRLRGRLRSEIADDLFQDVLQRHQAEQLAVFVHSQAHARLALLELLQLHEQGGVGRNEVGV